MRFLLLRSSPGSALFVLFCGRLFSSTAVASASTITLKNLIYRNRSRALAEAKLALTEYLHVTRALPFALVDHIASNSPMSLCSFVSQVPFGDAVPADYPRILRSFLAYHPVNEFDFFFESVGLPPSHPSFPSRSPLFLADDTRLLAAVSSLLRFGFPWDVLGRLYVEHGDIFSSPPDHLNRLLRIFEDLGFPRVCIIAICLTFPFTLHASGDLLETKLLLADLKILFLDYGLAACAGANMDMLLRFCERVRVFYDFGSEKGGMGELMGRSRWIFLEHDELIIARRLRFFLNLSMRMEDVGPFTLKNAELFNLDLEGEEIMIPDYLIRIGLSKEEADSLVKSYPYVMGKNRMGSLPGIMKALVLHKWFLFKLVHEENLHFLSPSYSCVDSCDSKLEIEFLRDLDRIKLFKQQQFLDVKVNFFLSIGFGQNKMMSKIAGKVSGNKKLLQERFDCLLGLGIEYSMLCKMINASPKILNQSNYMLVEKVNYLRRDLGYPVEYLNKFPAFLLFDIENRVKPRYRILNWLIENGLLKNSFSPATVLANSAKRFICILSNIHPAAPKQWLECFSCHKTNNADAQTI